MTLEKTENNIPKIIQHSAPPLTARLLTTDEMLLSLLLLAWSSRIQREIQVLGDKQVMNSNLQGLVDLQAEIQDAALALRYPRIVQDAIIDKQD